MSLTFLFLHWEKKYLTKVRVFLALQLVPMFSDCTVHLKMQVSAEQGVYFRGFMSDVGLHLLFGFHT